METYILIFISVAIIALGVMVAVKFSRAEEEHDESVDSIIGILSDTAVAMKMLQDRIEVLERDQKDKEEDREKEARLEKLFVDGISNILNYDLNPKKKGDE